MLVIGIGHKARQGKDTAARAIIKECAAQGLYAKQYGFCDALKAYCRVLGMREKDAPLLQTVGTNVFRHLDPDIWIRILQDTLREQQPDVAVITDVRFPNEVEGIRALGGKVIKVVRVDENWQPWVSPDRDPNHESEIALDSYKGWDAEFESLDALSLEQLVVCWFRKERMTP